MNAPLVVSDVGFQKAWVRATQLLASNRWERNNLVVHIEDVSNFDATFHDVYSTFCQTNGILGPKDVAYTIFPHKMYHKRGSISALCGAYNRSGGFYDKTRHRPRSGWGTYFRRMTAYEGRRGVVNQLDNIVSAIRSRRSTTQAGYTIVIQHPGGETIRPLGGPCLNYLAVQLKAGKPRRLGLLCIYRNHDFLVRAYGNYWGLCNLVQFLARETKSQPGPLTCISSHAYVPTCRKKLAAFLATV